MITVHIRKQGAAAIMTIPANVLKLLHVDVGTELELSVVNQSLVIKPVTQKRKHYSLKFLLKGATEKNIKALNKSTQWAREGKPRGREIA